MDEKLKHEWLEELKSLGLDGSKPDGVSVAEISEQVGHSKNWVRSKLREAMAAGRLRVERRPGVSVDGRSTFTPVYRLISL